MVIRRQRPVDLDGAALVPRHIDGLHLRGRNRRQVVGGGDGGGERQPVSGPARNQQTQQSRGSPYTKNAPSAVDGASIDSGSSPKLLPEQRLDLGGIGDGRAEVVRKTEEVVKINVAVGHDVVRGVVPFLTVG